MNIHNKYRTIYFARVYCVVSLPIFCPADGIYQSGQSLIEHSYKADSDLSSAGWEYAERLKDFVLERRAKTLEARGLSGEDRRLVVCHGVPTSVDCPSLIVFRYGHLLAVGLIILPGHSSRTQV